ncbi:acyl-CoA reductase [Aequorivita sp. SDUM287046]|uniref:long-chain-fatty-acyl-CoA reductase n=1 Tax=Aequorivita aurantiaca TaxID=3053356 RepID=A0ABT8DJB0_9FLAO|nr:acyl-CoA reductase [Aequorivita aurantiaca]MDN3723985.1 acyl-CoA reductase [Aequorivita aurantiaca]
MQLNQRINAFVELGKLLKDLAENETIAQTILAKAEAENGWFTRENILFSLNNWAEALTQANLLQWMSKYNVELLPQESNEVKKVAIIMAGNIPLVGFHDFLSVLMTGNKVITKLSSNDKTLLPFIAAQLIEIEPRFKDYVAFTEGKLEHFDMVIATGSNNTARYFEYYFGKYPNIIRKNRNSVAILNGTETEAELKLLADDIFVYFGLGCRNVSKLYVPEGYNFEAFFKAMYHWKEIIHNHKYINNYDYNKAVYLMDSFPLLDNEFMLLKEDKGFSSPISVVFFEKYDSEESLKKEVSKHSENIQCIVSKIGIDNEIRFGETQFPKLWDYADGVDTVAFLLDS